MTNNEQDTRRPRVFISYAQCSEVHSARVLALAQALRGHGIDTELDQYHKHELIDWPRWCQEQLRSDHAAWVLMVCSASYRDRFEGRADSDTGRGVCWEGALIDFEIYRAKANRRFVPILLDGESEGAIPAIVGGSTCFHIRGLDERDAGYLDLYRLLTGQQAIVKAPLGPPLALAPQSLARVSGAATDIEPSPTREQELAYLDQLLTGIELKARLYAPLRGIADVQPAGQAAAMLAPWADDEDIALLRHRPRRRLSATEMPAREYDDILAAFGDVPQAALLGAPGAGKSTTLRRLAADLARNARSEPRAPLPLFIALGDWRGDQDLTAFLAEQTPEIGPAALEPARAGRLILLLDGLNEVPTAKRKSKANDVLALKDRLPADTPFIVSCRRDDYVGDLDLGLDTLSLEPLSPQRIRGVLEHWLPDDADGVAPGSAERLFWQLAGDERLAAVLAGWLEAGSTEDAFWSVADPRDDEHAYAKTSGADDKIWRRHVPNPRSLLRLAANPFMLTMLYQVWAFEGELPRNRGDLFARFVDRLLSREGMLVKDRATRVWQRTPAGEQLVAGLTDIAWIMQGERVEQSAGGGGDLGVLTVVPRAVAVKQWGSERLLKQAEDATLLEGNDDFRFRHQLLQEYFTAGAMRSRIEAAPPMAAAELWPAQHWWQRSGWEESAVLLAGLYADDCTPVIRWLQDAQPEVTAQCILDGGAEIANRDALLKDLHDDWLQRLTALDRDAEPEARAAIGRALSRLDCDDRNGVGLSANGLPDIDWVEIPGGAFIYQNDERRQCENFRISRYPVTNAQFQAFVDSDDGYSDDRWWQGLDDPDRNPERSSWDYPNHPRERVSWFEAMAFCAWLSHRLKLDIRLPTEWEWERAARGINGRVYPWGDEYLAGHANINETRDDTGPHNLDRTCAVGIYPQGASPEGVLDLSGNVWEWCLNEYETPKRIQPGGNESRVLRGGSWLRSQDYARAVFRLDYHPNFRYYLIGFRVLRASPIR